MMECVELGFLGERWVVVEDVVVSVIYIPYVAAQPAAGPGKGLSHLDSTSQRPAAHQQMWRLFC